MSGSFMGRVMGTANIIKTETFEDRRWGICRSAVGKYRCFLENTSRETRS